MKGVIYTLVDVLSGGFLGRVLGRMREFDARLKEMEGELRSISTRLNQDHDQQQMETLRQFKSRNKGGKGA
ncbi:hypothetical protein [Billgrantia endophytica]|uniref:Uncharacterized protein n=1 Tax=Billgrantia endophytica TaxID=2033802 RepID=A0A2N7TXY9_9GAMM|nr:hypothetical protein [Halomonas endophytica]PMR73050.1 hypothetical protein C1H69_18905 [Halomonas endophytica]